MDKEFHYYINYLIASRAGFNPNEAGLIAQVCQATDENTKIYKVYSDSRLDYSNYISQTSDLLRPRFSRMRIYPVFHFIPGDTDFEGARRADRQTHRLNTTPDSELANRCIDEALLTKDLYQIGIACHAYADTWAHQNFVGYKEKYNKFEGIPEWVIPDIGHADAKHQPDWPGHIWSDYRLVNENRRINNKTRFLEAAERLFEKLANFNNYQNIASEKESLRQDLDIAIGETYPASRNRGKTYRVERYKILATHLKYNGKKISDFKLNDWLEQSLDYEGMTGRYYWREPKNHTSSNWYLFQEAVKQYQRRVLKLYEETAYAEISSDLREKIVHFS